MATDIFRTDGTAIIEIAPNAEGVIQITVEDRPIGYRIDTAGTVFPLTTEFANMLVTVPYTFELRTGENLFLKGKANIVLNEGTVVV